ncbi:transglycosylase SLT domain-containing protein [Candidimonas nitroreducens]|uniref:Transglycosylase SLT domain-containing protein n=1 Tax=Candidimonas nitroreducens TaxID=683354 RepID=A0A225MPL5_9BURK|nr:transglycosylase SLT domain-containing protein [Candidimonas nitroreducens]OWT61870.1 hypothetical protein CEY11_08540 [Candidimonas nitroreducens]
MDYNDFKKLSPDAAISAAASFSGFTPAEIRGIWHTESDNGQNKGPSSAGALGDFQIYPKTQQSLEGRLGIQFDPNDFHDSLFMAAQVLKENLGHFGNKPDALRAYNGGWDKAKWGNAETSAYAGKVLSAAGEKVVDTFQATEGLPAFTKAAARFQALDDSGVDAPLFKETGKPTEAFQAQYGPEDDPESGLYDEDARRLAFEGQHAGFAESVLDSMVHNTITGQLAAWVDEGKPDPSFNAMSDDNKAIIQKAGLYGNDQMMDYVLGAVNAKDFTHRLEVAQERSDLFRRMGNTPGWSPELGQLVGGMVDPVAILGSAGAGAAVSLTRGAAAAGRAARFMRGAAAGAAENVAIGELVDHMENQRFRMSSLLTNATFGAAMGGIGGLMHTPDGKLVTDDKVDVPEDFKPVLDNARENVEAVQNSISNRERAKGLAGDDPDGPVDDLSISTDAADMPNVDLGTGPSPGPRRVEREDGSVYYEGLTQEQYTPADAWSPTLGYKPEPTLGDPTYRALHDAGIITELRSAKDLPEVSSYQRHFGEAIPDDAQAVYIPQEDRVYVFKDRLTKENAENPMGLVMHEVGVHYGLERTVGTERYRQILGDLTKSEDARVREAMKAIPTDTPEHLRLEEALGYLVEKYPTLGVVQDIVAKLRNWLRENVPMFKNLAVSANDAIAYVRGSLERARREGKQSADLTFPYVWHGSPTKGIESLDLSYAGSGEGKSAFGFGHYVTSEKGTALDYRNKETARRGKPAESGGLYRLRVNADPAHMVDWDAPAAGQRAAAAFKEHGIELEGKTGGEAYNELAEKLGSQKAASEALAAAGVPGIKYATGRTRGANVKNSNYVLFRDSDLSMEARYSRTGQQPTQRNAPDYHGFTLNAREQAVADHLSTVNDKIDPAMQQQIDRLQAVLAKAPEWVKSKWAMSPGVSMSTSSSVHARQAGAVLFENSIGSAARPRNGTVSMDFERLRSAYSSPFLLQADPHITGLMTTKEKLDHMAGGIKARQRISTLAIEERMKHRAAVQAGVAHVSTAPAAVQKLASIMDQQVFKMVEDGVAAGSEYADAVKGGGVVGFMPQIWNWRKFGEALENDKPTWNALRKNFKQQYMERQVDPVLAEMVKDGADPAAIAAARDRLVQQVDSQVDNRLLKALQSPDERVTGEGLEYETLAAQLLDELFHGAEVTDDVIAQFRDKLTALRKDYSRTEFDLLREVDGVRLLDYVEHDLPETITHMARRFAGQTAMAKHGFKSKADFDSLLKLVQQDGPRRQDIEHIKFAGRAFGFAPMVVKDYPLLEALGNFTYSSIMGKLGIANLADLSNMVTALGIGQLPQVVGLALSKETPIVKQLGEMFGTGLTGADHRIQKYTADLKPNGRAMHGFGERILRISQRVAHATGYISGAHAVTRMLHKAFLPLLTETFVRAARGLDGGMSTARLADAGLSKEVLARIKTQLDKYEPSRKEGDAFHWDKWDDQYAADRMIDAIHRATYQVLQRALIGEAPMWRSESAIGAVLGQFHGYGMTAMGKQVIRNAALFDARTAAAFSFGLVWASLLYYSRLQLNTAGMSATAAREYMDKNTKGFALAQGVLTYFNMSGILPEGVGVADVLFGGHAYQNAPEAAAAISFYGNTTKAAHGVVNLLTGSDNPNRDKRAILRIVPGGNSIIGTYMMNHWKEPD